MRCLPEVAARADRQTEEREREDSGEGGAREEARKGWRRRRAEGKERHCRMSLLACKLVPHSGYIVQIDSTFEGHL